jgi:hypothetical protein
MRLLIQKIFLEIVPSDAHYIGKEGNLASVLQNKEVSSYGRECSDERNEARKCRCRVEGRRIGQEERQGRLGSRLLGLGLCSPN